MSQLAHRLTVRSSWKEFVRQPLSSLSSVSRHLRKLGTKKEIAATKSNGYVLGKISSVLSSGAWDDGRSEDVVLTKRLSE